MIIDKKIHKPFMSNFTYFEIISDSPVTADDMLAVQREFGYAPAGARGPMNIACHPPGPGRPHHVTRWASWSNEVNK